MRRIPAWSVVACMVVAALSPALAAQGGTPKHVVIPLRRATGHSVAKSLTPTARPGQTAPASVKIDGINYLAVDEVRGAVLAVGTDNGIANLRKVVALLDVPTRAITVRMRLVRSTRQADGSLTTEVVGAPVVKTPNDEEATVTVGDDRTRYSAGVLARLNGDDTVTITAELRVERGAHAGAYHRSTKRLPQGRSVVIAWTPDVFNKAAANSDMLGLQPVTPHEQPGLFLEVSATAEPAPTGR